MKKMTTAELRQAFLQYFQQKGHELVSSSPLVPANDPTLLFTNAGMVQFKDVFLGLDQRHYRRATSSQRCVRAGGKHNDLENVGYTARHHTFFEMLGNFSFGDYFKVDAIRFAWEFLTEVLQLPKDKLWVTVFESDDEAAEIWMNEIGVDPARITRCGEKDNFWSMGDTGPCGPCTEIFYDHGPSIPGGPPGTPDADGDRYIEIWNLVFMQFDRSANGELTPLPKPSVDTGMGLERISAVLQNVHSNYEIDIFQALIAAIQKITKTADSTHASLRVIADHIRSCSFLITDGVVPSNEGRGYVLRRIIRRAIRHGAKLGVNEPFFFRLVKPLVEQMGEAFPELTKAQSVVEKVLLLEEEQFAKTLEQGLKIFEENLALLKGKVIPGELIFKLYDTYGFPVDLTQDMARERELTLDMPGFELLMANQRQQSQAASQFTSEAARKISLKAESEFLGYEHLEHPAKITHILIDGQEVQQLKPNQDAVIVLDRSPFYAESGGQVGDQGELQLGKVIFSVADTQKNQQAILHVGKLQSGELKVGDVIDAKVDFISRQQTMLNHSATHLLHAALRVVLGEHVLQKGSLVEPARLRFDFAHFEAMTPSQIQQVEELVNEKIRADFAVETNIMNAENAKKSGAMALFGEKYGENVRVLSMGDFSKELCGGTHVARTGQIGLFKMTQEAGTAAGVRRIEAVTGAAALQYVNQKLEQLQLIAKTLRTSEQLVVEKVEQLSASLRESEKQAEQLKQKMNASVGNDLASRAVVVDGVKVLAAKLEGADPKTLRTTLDQLKEQLGRSVIVLASVSDGRVSVVAGMSADCVGKVPSAKDLVASVCGKGGGRDDMAQGGGPLPADLDARLNGITQLIQSQSVV